MKAAIGIDLGTAFVRAGVVKNNRVQIIADGDHNYAIPSTVTCVGREYMVEGKARSRVSTIPECVIFDAKAMLGMDFQTASTFAQSKGLPYHVAGQGDEITLQMKGDPQAHTFRPEEILSMLLEEVRRNAQNHIGQGIQHAIITVPAHFDEKQNLAVRYAGARAGLHVLGLIDEPVAVAIAHPIDFDHPAKQSIMVVDIGQTTKVSLLSVGMGECTVRGAVSSTATAVDNFDDRLVKRGVAKFVAAYKSPVLPTNATSSTNQLPPEHNDGINLPLLDHVTKIDRLHDGITLATPITRREFYCMCRDILCSITQLLDLTLARAGIEKSLVDRVILVGGSATYPYVKETVTEYFGPEKIKTSPYLLESGVCGAAVRASAMFDQKPYSPVDTTTAKGALPLSIGIETAGGLMHILIPKGTPLPAQASSTFTTFSDDQSKISIPFFLGERTLTRYNHPLGQIDLSHIPVGPGSAPELIVSLHIDTDGDLLATALNPAGTTCSQLLITRDRMDLSDDTLTRMLAEAATNRMEDEAQTTRVDAKNRLVHYAWSLIQTILDSPSVTVQEKQVFNDKIEEIQHFVNMDLELTVEEYAMHYSGLTQVAQPLLEKINRLGANDA